MKPSRLFALACVISACASGAAGNKSAAPDQPPRLAVAAPEPPGITAIPSLCGLAVVGNTGELHFRMELAGKHVEVRPGGPTETYLVDGLQVQVSTIPSNDISPKARGLVGIELLRLHAAFESARQSEALGREVKAEEIEILAADNMPSALVWWFPSEEGGSSEGSSPSEGDSPSESHRPTGLAFMTAAYGRWVLVLSVQGQHGEARTALVAKAKSWMATVATSSRTISARQVTEEIQAAKAAGQTCRGESEGPEGWRRAEGSSRREPAWAGIAARAPDHAVTTTTARVVSGYSSPSP
jgi:hypothetical protein